MPPDSPDFKALFQQGAKPDFHAMLAAGPTEAQADPPPDNTPVGPRDTGRDIGSDPLLDPTKNVLADPRIPSVGGNPLGALATGVGRGLTGVVGLIADQIDPALGDRVATLQRTLSRSLLGANPSGKDQILEGVGEAAPFAAVPLGEVAKGISVARAAGKAALVGAAAGAASPQDDADSGERQEGRVDQAVVGGLGGGLFGGAARAITNRVAQAANTKALKTYFKDAEEFFKDYTPTAEGLAEAVKPDVAHIAGRYQTAVAATRRATNATGGVDVKPVIEALEKGAGGDSKTGTAKLLKELQSDLKPYQEKPAENPKMANQVKTMGLGSEVEKQILEGLGPETKPTPGLPGDLIHLRQVSEKIEDHIEKLSPEAAAAPEVGKLRDVQKAIDGQTDKFLKDHPHINDLYNGMKNRFQPLVKASKLPEVQQLMSPDPATRTGVILDAVKTGDTKRLGNLTQFMGPVGSEARQDAFHVVLHDAYTSSIGNDGNVDAKKFAAYFKEPGVKKGLDALGAPRTSDIVKGMSNLIDYDKVAAEGRKSHLSPKRVSLIQGLILGRGMEETAMGSAKLLVGTGSVAGAAMPVVTAAAGAAILGKTSKALDSFMTKKGGSAFLIAASKVSPDSPRFARLVDAMNRKITPAVTKGAPVLATPQSSPPPLQEQGN